MKNIISPLNTLCTASIFFPHPYFAAEYLLHDRHLLSPPSFLHLIPSTRPQSSFPILISLLNTFTTLMPPMHVSVCPNTFLLIF
ncbi:hypothetical protein SCLCIDRAFT_174614 [Scleroderma citrinum Foug A]|uniref:Uncharacterized protein n=1 Tax=Scleroderma citrinum Foug A TaxID=1036808 RepID=A0A0C3EDX1_9AGAM|nr:hypothetical protein SCLCIDRAFT_174614 [Scleroderma citrinum Foug A]